MAGAGWCCGFLCWGARKDGLGVRLGSRHVGVVLLPCQAVMVVGKGLLDAALRGDDVVFELLELIDARAERALVALKGVVGEARRGAIGVGVWLIVWGSAELSHDCYVDWMLSLSKILE